MKRLFAPALVLLLATGAAAETATVPITFSHHATERLAERHIRRAWVEHVLRDPDWVEPDRYNPSVHLAFGAIPEAHAQILRVVYVELGNRELVISEYSDREAVRRAPRH